MDKMRTKKKMEDKDLFIVSKNVEVLSQKTIGLDFVNSDHNPIEMVIRLK